MRCPKSKRISAYLDHELTDHERTLFETHLKNCDRCSHELQEMKALQAVFSTATRYKAPYGFSTRVVARAMSQKDKRAPWFVPAMIEFTEALVLVIVISIGFTAGKLLLNGQSTPKPANIASTFSLDIFEPAPPGSLGGAYLAFVEAGNEK
jgi:anti-sigma factor RsiW